VAALSEAWALIALTPRPWVRIPRRNECLSSSVHHLLVTLSPTLHSLVTKKRSKINYQTTFESSQHSATHPVLKMTSEIKRPNRVLYEARSLITLKRTFRAAFGKKKISEKETRCINVRSERCWRKQSAFRKENDQSNTVD
jgi:hypothetical protein